MQKQISRNNSKDSLVLNKSNADFKKISRNTSKETVHTKIDTKSTLKGNKISVQSKKQIQRAKDSSTIITNRQQKSINKTILMNRSMNKENQHPNAMKPNTSMSKQKKNNQSIKKIGSKNNSVIAKTESSDQKIQKGRTFKNIRQTLANKPIVRTTQTKLKIKEQSQSKNTTPKIQVFIQELQLPKINQNTSKKLQYQQEKEKGSIQKYIPANILKLKNTKQLSKQDFLILRTTKEAQYYNQYFALHRDTGCLFTLQMLDKYVIKSMQIEQQLIEAIRIHCFFSNTLLCNIQKVYHFFEDATHIFLILEPIPPNSQQSYPLTHLLQTKKELPEEQIAYIIKNILSSVKEFHRNGIIIRSLNVSSLENCLGVWKIVCFDKVASTRVTKRRNSFLGQIQVIPQQLALGKNYDISYDMWNIGLLIYEMATNTKPFSGPSAHSSIKQLQFSFPMLLSFDLVDLLSKLLTQETSRLTCDQCLKSRFLSRQFLQRDQVIRQFWSFWMC